MADFKEMIKILARICKKHPYCVGCPINELRQRNGNHLACLPAIAENHEKAESIILKWAEENPPIKTNANKFKEVFGVEVNVDYCVLVHGSECEKHEKCNTCPYNFTKFWEQEYKEPDKED